MEMEIQLGDLGEARSIKTMLPYVDHSTNRPHGRVLISKFAIGTPMQCAI